MIIIENVCSGLPCDVKHKSFSEIVLGVVAVVGWSCWNIIIVKLNTDGEWLTSHTVPRIIDHQLINPQLNVCPDFFFFSELQHCIDMNIIIIYA